MSVPTLQQLIEEKDGKTVVAKIIIGGTELPVWTNCTYQFEMGQVPTATITVPGIAHLPAAVAEEAAVQIWFGYKVGVTVLTKLVFGGAIVDSVGNNGSDVVITCVMDGPRKLSYSYNRRIAFDFDNVTAVESVTALLELAGVANYSVNLDPWLIGTAVPYTAALGNQIQFSSYGDAVNKVAEVDGSPWYAMPSGQVRVEKRDAVPSPTARRVYFTSVLTGPVESQPVGVTNPLARPRINDISKNKNRRDVANFIEVDGAVVVSFGPNGEQNSDQIKETVDGASGQFPNGAYWIPTPPLFQDFNFSNELIDTNAKAFEVCERYFDLKNRLFEELPITVPGDPDVFLGETVEVKDPIYSGTGSLYFVKGYSTTIDQSSCTTSLELIGGPEAGTTGFAAPFAEFTWTYDPLIIPGGGLNPINLGPNSTPAAKLCEDKPADSTPPDNTDTPDQGDDTAMVYIGLDGSASQDFDGFIVSWEWEWRDSDNVLHNLSGVRNTIVVDPQGSVNVTLTVTDNSGRTDSITKNINTSVNTSNPPSYDPSMNDTPDGGGVTAGPCTEEPAFPNPYCFGDNCDEGKTPGGCNGLELGYFVAAKTVAMGSVDNRIWHDLTKAAAGVSGDFISVDAAVNNQAQKSSAIFGTTEGEIVKSTDICATGTLVFTVPGNPRIECIHFDTQQIGSPTGELPPTEDPPVVNSGNIPVYTQSNPGTMTIVQAYQQCRAVGFSHDTAIVAVAIMVRESGLYSKAMNTAGNTPPSTDRGICQWNDFYHPDISDACAYNTECAITQMFKKSSGGSDFSPWNVSGPGTYLQKTNPAAVQAAVSGVSDTTITPQKPTIQVSPAGLKVWAGTSDGRVYVSLDSGETWELWVDFRDGLPIKQIGTPPRYGAQAFSLWVFGGDSGTIDSLVRIDPATDKNFVPLFIAGDLRSALQTAGAGDTCYSSMNDTASILVFSGGGMTERVWTNPDPLGAPDGWVACGVTTGAYNTVAPGYSGEFVIAGSVIEKTSDNENFSSLGSGPSTVNQMLWRGLPGMYALALDDGLYTSIDFGDTLGPLRPNTTFSTTWPVGAIGYQVAVSYGARTCPTPTPGECDQAPRYEAAVGMQAVSANYLTNGQQISDSIVGASVDTPDTSLITTFYEGSAHHKSLGHKSSTGSSLIIEIFPSIIDSFIFLAVASRPGDIPTSVTDSQSLTWDLIQSELSSDSVGPIRLSIYRTNANAASVLGLTVTVAFGSAQDIILAISDEWIGLSATPGTDPVVDSDVEFNSNNSPSDYPNDYLLSYTFNNPYAFEEAIPAPVSFGIALQLEACSGESSAMIAAVQGGVSGDLVMVGLDNSVWSEISRPTGIDNAPVFNTFLTKLGNNHWFGAFNNTGGGVWQLFKSSDGCVTFSQRLVDSDLPTPICISSDGTLWACFTTGGSCEIHKSTDEGENFTHVFTLSGVPVIESAAAHPSDANVIVFVGHAAAGGDPWVVVTTNGGTSFTEFGLGGTNDESSGYETMSARFLASGRFVFIADIALGTPEIQAFWSDTPGNSGSYTIVTLATDAAGFTCDALTALSPFGEPIFAIVAPCSVPADKAVAVYRSTDGDTWDTISVAGFPDFEGPIAAFYKESEDRLYVWGFNTSDTVWALEEASGAATTWTHITGVAAAIGEASAYPWIQMNLTKA